MAEAATTAALSLTDFLAWEQAQEMRYERVARVVRMMAGGTLTHDRIASNIIAALSTQLRGSQCFAQGSNLKVVSPHGDVMYPDAFVLCGPHAGNLTAVEDPVVVFEVLSEGTAQYDLTRKRLAYKTIPSLKAIVYVASDRVRIDLVRRQADGRWDDEDALEGTGAVLELPEVGVTLRLPAIYVDTESARDNRPDEVEER
jgi:Uma2 family endonuclease